MSDLVLTREPGEAAYRTLLAVGRRSGRVETSATFDVGSDGLVPAPVLTEKLQPALGAGPRPAITATRRPPPRGRTRRHSPRVARPLVSVVVPTCANPEPLERCVRSILRSDYKGKFEVIVVENRPHQADTEAVLRAAFPEDERIRCVAEPHPGASAARNAGLAHAAGTIVAFADDDVVVDERWLRESVEAILRSRDTACVTGLILPLELESEAQILMEQFAGFGKGFRRRTFRLPQSQLHDPLFPYTAGSIGSGASIVMRTEVARELGGFDRVLGPGTPCTGAEDLEMFIRVLRAGYAVAYEPRAAVWHRHPDSPTRLRRQVFRYGVGMGAMLAKQLIAGPERRDLLRAVPRGVRYARDPGSRKNAGKPPGFPRHLTWLERLGLASGPLAYLYSLLLHALRPPSSQVERLTLRLVAAASLLAPLSASLAAPTIVRLPLVFTLLCVAPGMALLSVLRARLDAGLVLGVGIAVSELLALGMVTTGGWAPIGVLYPLAVLCAVPLVARLRVVVPPGPASAVRQRRRVLDLASALQSSLDRSTWAHLGVIAASLVLWGLALAGTQLGAIDGFGLVRALPLPFFLALAGLLGGFVFAVARQQPRPWVLAAYVFSVILVVHATTALLYSEPRYAWVYKHLGVINLIGSTGTIDREIDIYNNWPSFFAANAWFSRGAGLAPIGYAAFAQVFFNVLNVLAMRFALRAFTRNERLLWTASLLFVIGNWTGQDYLSPQANGFALSVLTVGVCLRCPVVPPGPRRGLAARVARRIPGLALHDPRPVDCPLGPRAALLVGAICFLAIVTSHQLSPVLLIVQVVAIALVARSVPRWVLAGLVLVEVWWVVLAWDFVNRHFTLIDLGGSPSAALVTRNLAAAPAGAGLSFRAPAIVTGLMVVLAAAGFVAQRRSSRRNLVLLALIVAPVLVAVVQPYGGEGPYRAYLFALPWLAFLGADVCLRVLTGATRSWRSRLVPILVMPWLVPALLIGQFGQELANHVLSGDVAASTWYEQHAPAGSVRLNLAPNAPDRLTARYPLVSLDDPSTLVETPGFAGHRLGQGDIPRLQRVVAKQGAHPVYVVLTVGQENAARLNGLLPRGSAAGLAAALRRSPDFRLVFARQGAWIFSFTDSVGLRLRPGAS